MSEITEAMQLRHRAQHLRELATSIEALPAMSLDSHAGDDTWRGRRALLCRSLLATSQHHLHAAADDLRTHASRFDRAADELDATFRLRTGPAG